MSKHRTPRSGYIDRNDSATDSFYADYQENLGIADDKDAEHEAAITEEVERAIQAGQNLATAIGTSSAAVDDLKPGSTAWLKANVNNVEYLSITRDSNNAATSATVKWPDGAAGVYTAATLSTAFPGAVDANTLTYGSGGSTKTVAQAAVTRDPSTGAVTDAPALVVS